MRRFFIILSFVSALMLMPGHAWAASVIMIDAGHGGSDPGAIGVNGLREKDVNLDIALKLRKELQNLGYEVLMTRENDFYISLSDRVSMARSSTSELFVSVHANSHPNSSASGSLVLYYDNRYPEPGYPASTEMAMLSGDSYQLASSVLDSLTGAVQTKNMGVVPSSVYVVRNGRVPSILVETAFLSNQSDAELLASEEARSAMARAIAEGISQYKPSVFMDMWRHWASEPVLRLEKLGIVYGNNGLFKPERGLTRAEFVAMLDRVFSFDSLLAQSEDMESTLEKANANMPDVRPTHWAYGHIAKAVELGVLQGFEDGTVRPDKSISRAEVAVIFDRIAMAEWSPQQVELPFLDTVLQSWYQASVNKMYLRGWMTGVSDQRFAPGKTMTRAEVASVLDRYLSSNDGLAIQALLAMRNNVM